MASALLNLTRFGLCSFLMSFGRSSSRLRAETTAKMMICHVRFAPQPAMMAVTAAPIAKQSRKKSPEDNSRIRHTIEMITQISQRLDVKNSIIVVFFYWLLFFLSFFLFFRLISIRRIMPSKNYTRWRIFFLSLVARKMSLDHHVKVSSLVIVFTISKGKIFLSNMQILCQNE